MVVVFGCIVEVVACLNIFICLHCFGVWEEGLGVGGSFHIVGFAVCIHTLEYPRNFKG